MGLEVGTYIDDLNINNPLSGDLKSVGDNHLRLIKQTLKNTFPNATKPFPFPRVQTTAPPAVIPSSSNGLTYMVSTAGSPTIQLPALTSGDAGWECGFIKNSLDANAMFIIPPAAMTLWSGEYWGLSKCRRAIPGRRFTAYWSGGEWFVSRVLGVPLGTVVSTFYGSLALGYVWPNGVALSGATYPEYVLHVHGSGTIPDLRGRVEVGADQGVGRIGNVLGGGYGNAAGTEIHYLTADQQASMGVGGSVGYNPQSLDHNHSYTDNYTVGGYGGGGPFASGGPYGPGGDTRDTSGANYHSNGIGGGHGHHTHNIDSATAFGGNNWHNNMQPSYVMHKMLVVE